MEDITNIVELFKASFSLKVVSDIYDISLSD